MNNFIKSKINFILISLFVISNLIFWDFAVYGYNIKNFYLFFIICFFLKDKKIDYKNLSYLFIVLIALTLHSLPHILDINQWMKVNLLLYLTIILVFLNFDIILKNLQNYILISFYIVVFYFFIFVPIKFFLFFKDSQNIINDIWNHLAHKFTIYCNGLTINNFNLIFNENSHLGMVFPALHFYYILKSKNNIYVYLLFNALSLCIIVLFSSLTMLVSYLICISLYFFFFLFKKVKLKKNPVLIILILSTFIGIFLSSFSGCKIKFFDIAYSLLFKEDSASITKQMEKIIDDETHRFYLYNNCNLISPSLSGVDILPINNSMSNFEDKCILIVTKQTGIEKKLIEILSQLEELHNIPIFIKENSLVEIISRNEIELIIKKHVEENYKPSKVNKVLESIYVEMKKDNDQDKINNKQYAILKNGLFDHHPNVSSLTYSKHLKMTLISLVDKPLGWGLNNYASAFFNYSNKIEDLSGLHFKNRHMNANYSDGSSNLFKLLVEFGLVSIFIFFIIYKFIKSNVDPILKIFILGLIFTSFVRAAGYFNSAFLLCIIIMIASSYKEFKLIK